MDAELRAAERQNDGTVEDRLRLIRERARAGLVEPPCGVGAAGEEPRCARRSLRSAGGAD